MRRILLGLVITAILFQMKGDRVLQVTIVVPPVLNTYYECLVDSLPNEPAPEKPDPFEYRIEYSTDIFAPNQKVTSSSIGV